MVREKRIHSFNLWFADFETFTPDSLYFKRNSVYKKDGTLDISKCRTRAYIWSLVKIPVWYNNHLKPHAQWTFTNNKKPKAYLGVDMNELFKKMIYDSDKQRYRFKHKLIFHNGMGWDQWFILFWLQEQENFKAVLNDDIYQKDGDDETRNEKLKDRPYNFYTASVACQYFCLSIYIWIPSVKKHAVITCYDSMKWIPGSVENISKEYCIGKNAIMDEWLKENYPDINKDDLEKKSLDLDYVQDIDNEYIYTRDDGKILIKDFITRNNTTKTGVKAIQERVFGDSIIMAYVVAYCILNEIISVSIDGRIKGTSSSIALQKFTHEYCLTHNITNKDDKNPKNFWNKNIYLIDEQDRQEVNNLFRNYRTGGFCSLNENYQGFWIKRDDIKSYDVCSLYPSICVDNELPYGKVTIMDKLPKNLKHKFVFVSFEADRIQQHIKDRTTAMIPYKWYDGIKPKDVHYTKDLKGPIKGFTILKAFKDIYSNEKRFTIDNLHNIKYYVFNSDYYLKEFMSEKYKIKQHATKASEKKAAKTVMNGFTGKAAQSEDNIETTMSLYSFLDMFDNVDDLYKQAQDMNIIGEYSEWEKLYEAYQNKDWITIQNLTYETSSDVPYAYFPLYIAITSLGRYKTMKTEWEHIEAAKNNVALYHDTDSYKFFGKDLDNSITTNKKESKLGYWLEEFKGEVDELIIWEPKTWIGYKSKIKVDDERKRYVLATGGIRPDDVIDYCIKHNRELKKEVKIKTKASHKCIGGKVLIECEKEL